ncbi:MAG: 30S ribosomal protein S8 [Actinomycetota bacterium]|nr:30S ribosomal protein S8 [Actinomycetota bacterium]
MTMTDPVADMLTRIRNANVAYKEEISMPSSKLKTAIADILKREGYLRDFAVEPTRPQATLRLALKYSRDRERALSGLRRVSKPGLRVYARHDEIPRVLGGLGIAIISTSSGLMTDRQARQQRVGGEVLAYVW